MPTGLQEVIEQRVAARCTGRSIAELDSLLKERPDDTTKPFRITGGFPKPGGTGMSRGYYLDDLLAKWPNMKRPKPEEIHREGKPEPTVVEEEEEEEEEPPPPPPFTVPKATLDILWDLDPADYIEKVAAYIAVDPRAEEWFRKHPPFPNTRAGGGQAAPQQGAPPPPQTPTGHPFRPPTPSSRYAHPPPPVTIPAKGMLWVAALIAVGFFVFQVPHVLTGGPTRDIAEINAAAKLPLPPRSVPVSPPGPLALSAITPPRVPEPLDSGLFGVQPDGKILWPCRRPAFDSGKQYYDENTCTVRDRAVVLPSGGYPNWPQQAAPKKTAAPRTARTASNGGRHSVPAHTSAITADDLNRGMLRYLAHPPPTSWN